MCVGGGGGVTSCPAKEVPQPSDPTLSPQNRCGLGGKGRVTWLGYPLPPDRTRAPPPPDKTKGYLARVPLSLPRRDEG